MDPRHPRQHAIPLNSTTSISLLPLDFPQEEPQGHFQNTQLLGSLDNLPDVGVGVGVVASAPVFHPPGLLDFPNPFTSSPSGTVVNTASEPDHLHDVLLELERENQLNQRRNRELMLQTHENARPPTPVTASRDAVPPRHPPPRASRQALTAARRKGVGYIRRNVNADAAKSGSLNALPSVELPHNAQGPVKIALNPPDLDHWRQKLFDLDVPVIMTLDEFETYFPYIDNIYSHRSTQPYKRKTALTLYYDCRLKGRPAGTPKTTDPKRKRKRSVRPLNQCNVKIKITEYLPGAAAAGDIWEDEALVEALGWQGVQREVERVGDGACRVLQRMDGFVNPNGGAGVGSGGRAGQEALPRHEHDLRRSDEVKRSTAHRWFVEREREAKRSLRPSPWKATGAAAATARGHEVEVELKFYAACFCPFSQRVWIALEAKGLKYQYCETYPLRRPKPRPLLEANPRGLVPAIRVKDWACSESSIILEYFEDNYSTIPLHPSDARLKANCRLWIDFINTKIVPAFCAVLSATDDEARQPAMDRLHRDMSQLVQDAADERAGPYFLGNDMCLVDVHLAPFALRISRLPPFKNWPLPTPETRWKTWVKALEENESVKGTMSGRALYVQTMDDLVKGLQGMVE